MFDERWNFSMIDVKRRFGNYQNILVPVFLGIVGFFFIIKPVELVLGFLKQQFFDFIYAYNPQIYHFPHYQAVLTFMVCSILIGFFIASTNWFSRLSNSNFIKNQLPTLLVIPMR